MFIAPIYMLTNTILADGKSQCMNPIDSGITGWDCRCRHGNGKSRFRAHLDATNCRLDLSFFFGCIELMVFLAGSAGINRDLLHSAGVDLGTPRVTLCMVKRSWLSHLVQLVQLVQLERRRKHA